MSFQTSADKKTESRVGHKSICFSGRPGTESSIDPIFRFSLLLIFVQFLVIIGALAATLLLAKLEFALAGQYVLHPIRQHRVSFLKRARPWVKSLSRRA